MAEFHNTLAFLNGEVFVKKSEANRVCNLEMLKNVSVPNMRRGFRDMNIQRASPEFCKVGPVSKLG
jgi:hypothetical protein